tara:strand:- start:1415 stop:2767 length:1353 start_codon:yes stop_codon:yes gene_type:complete
MNSQYINFSNEYFPDNTFINYNDFKITFSEFYYNVSSKSRILTNLGLIDQKVIGIFLTNQIDILEIYFSCLQLKIIPVILPADITTLELQNLLQKHKIKFLISEWTRKPQIKKISKIQTFYVQEMSASYGGCKNLEFDNIIKDNNTIQSMHLTSGSTGIPKLISLTYNNFKSSIKQWSKEIKFSKNDKYIQCLPLNHIGGLSVIMRSQLIGFETIILDKFSSQKINFIIDQGANYVSLVPSMVRRLLNQRAGRPFPKTFKGIIMGGDAASIVLLNELLKKNVPTYKVYGMTETSSGICGFWINKYPKMINSVGKPFCDTKISIENSLISINGPSVTPYKIDGKPTSNTIATCDIGYFDKRFLFLKGRIDDMVISGGENISISQINSILLSNKNILDVHIQVIRDDTIGDKIVAYVCLKNKISKDEIIEYCLEFIPRAKLPHEIEIVENIM